jgi:hypothetical protein
MGHASTSHRKRSAVSLPALTGGAMPLVPILNASFSRTFHELPELCSALSLLGEKASSSLLGCLGFKFNNLKSIEITLIRLFLFPSHF